jgi:putative membrane protein
VFLLQSEWPKFGTEGQGGWRKFGSGWLSPGAGLITFALAGLLGFILRYRPVVAPEISFNNIMPAFVGLFAVPWLGQNIAGPARLPPQETGSMPRVNGRLLLRGAAAGTLGGAFAAFFPGITGGIGGLLAGHAAAVREDRVFLVSQGASKMVYYAGAFLLYFVPGPNLVRGMGAWIAREFYVPHAQYACYAALAAAAISAALAFALTAVLGRAMARLVSVVNSRAVSCCALALMFPIVLAGAGLDGLFVMLVASAIGAIPAVFQSRRMNCLGVILLPMACSMSGVGGKVAEFLGLI